MSICRLNSADILVLYYSTKLAYLGFEPNMSFSSYLCHSLATLKVDHMGLTLRPKLNVRVEQRFSYSFKSNSSELCGQRVASVDADLCRDWSFLGGARATVRPKLARCVLDKRGSGIYDSWLSSPQIANSVFTLGTAAVLPFYTLMVLAPKSELTKKSIESSVPYVALGLLYAYLLYLSWTPDTIRLIFAGKYWLPELPSIAKMFSSEMTLASAWIHLLVVDLFAARQVFHDGMENEIETRHSVSLCLLFCPIGIVTHVITKALTKSSRSA